MSPHGRLVAALVVVVALLQLCMLPTICMAAVQYDYGDALMRSLLYFEGQRSGKLPTQQRVTWRENSGLSDGNSAGVDLTGGYYDAGDNVKFGFPMAFTVTMLAWGVIEYKTQLQSANQLAYALDAIQWGTDYFIKAHTAPNVFFGEVGDGYSDHACWMRPEDMTTPRGAYQINASHPGSDLAGETAAAMAAASIVFQDLDPTYSANLLSHARQLFSFADTYRGKYSDSITIVDSFYESWSGYDDELLWAAVWLYDATGDQSYLQYLINNAASLGGTGNAMDQFSWDNKYAGVQVKATKLLLDGKSSMANTATLQAYQAKAEYFLCAALQKNSGSQIPKSPGGLFWIQPWNNMQYVATTSFLLTVAYDYYTNAGKTLSHCTSSVQNSELLAAATSQVDYILGSNPRGTSYVVGFGSSYPPQVHHRGSSIVSIKQNSQFVSCSDGFTQFYFSSSPNPNVHNGALVGGPDENDNFQDSRSNYEMTEPATCNTAPMVGVFARLAAGGGASTSSAFYTSEESPDPQPSRAWRRVGAGPEVVAATAAAEAARVQQQHLVEITRSFADEWNLKGKIYYKYSGKITNNCTSSTLTNVTLVVHNLQGATSVWGLEKLPGNPKGNIYTLPQWMPSLKPKQSIKFAYVNLARHGQAKFFLLSYKLQQSA
ncbi:unnamed protein product [Sphagnum balticum]